MSDDLVSTAQAAALLGVRPETIYAYVSRGLLHRADASSRHDGSSFHRADVVALRDTRRRSRDGIFEVGVDTAISRLDPDGRLAYRGRDITELVGGSYESVAELLWESGELDWRAGSVDGTAGRAAASVEAPGASPAARIRVAVATLSALDPVADLPTAGVRAINAALTALGPSDEDAVPTDRPVAERLADRLGTPYVDVVRAALVCLADHELATSTIAARVAAGTGAGPYAVLLAGLGALPGPRHGTASVAALDLLRTAARDGVGVAAGDTAGRAAGFGHIVYRDTDPRAGILLDLLRPIAPDTVELVDALTVEVVRRHSLWPNVDLALAAAVVGLGLPDHSGETVFTIARMAGFLAHAREEQGHPLRFRPRASYVGPSGAPDPDRVTEVAAAQADPRSANSDG